MWGRAAVMWLLLTHQAGGVRVARCTNRSSLVCPRITQTHQQLDAALTSDWSANDMDGAQLWASDDADTHQLLALTPGRLDPVPSRRWRGKLLLRVPFEDGAPLVLHQGDGVEHNVLSLCRRQQTSALNCAEILRIVRGALLPVRQHMVSGLRLSGAPKIHRPPERLLLNSVDTLADCSCHVAAAANVSEVRTTSCHASV